MSIAAAVDASSLIASIGSLPADVNAFTVLIDRTPTLPQTIIAAGVGILTLGVVTLIVWLMLRSIERDAIRAHQRATAP